MDNIMKVGLRVRRDEHFPKVFRGLLREPFED